MRTVLGRTAGRASLIVVSAAVVGSAVCPAVPAAAGAANHRASVHHPVTAGDQKHRSEVQIGTAVKFVREPDGSVRQVR
jgi:hypothetical protein